MSAVLWGGVLAVVWLALCAAGTWWVTEGWESLAGWLERLEDAMHPEFPGDAEEDDQ